MAATGLRVAEATKLKRKHIKWLSSQRIDVRFKGKGRKKRVVPLVDPNIIQALQNLLSMPDVNSKYVFPGNRGSRMSTANFEDRVYRCLLYTSPSPRD